MSLSVVQRLLHILLERTASLNARNETFQYLFSEMRSPSDCTYLVLKQVLKDVVKGAAAETCVWLCCDVNMLLWLLCTYT